MINEKVISILVIDDDQTWFDNIQEHLIETTDLEFNIDWANSPAIAYEKIESLGRKYIYDLFIVDIFYHNQMLGYDVIKQIRGYPWCGDSQIYLISSRYYYDYIKANQLNVSGFISKLYFSEDIQQIVKYMENISEEQIDMKKTKKRENTTNANEYSNGLNSDWNSKRQMPYDMYSLKEIKVKGPIISIRPNVRCKIVKILDIEENYVDENQYVAYCTAEKGTVTEGEIVAQWTQKDKKASFTEGTLHSLLGGKISVFMSEVAKKVEGEIKTGFSYEESNEVILKSTRKRKVLPLEEVNDNGASLQKRYYEASPIFVRIKILVEICCDTCKIPNLKEITLDYYTSKIQTRHREYYDDKTIKIINTGEDTAEIFFH